MAVGPAPPGGLTLDDALSRYIGEFGRAQVRLMLLVSLFWVTNGTLSDARGRKPVLFGCTAVGAVFTLAAGLAPNYAAYFVFRLLTGVGAAGQALTTYVLATESVGPSWRGTAGVATQLFFVLGGRPGCNLARSQSNMRRP
ncbi:Organic cation/carnitine transporter 4 [Tetrabaena socialis]|uniref:Organic cation/carnitine transporter 4 n=1 Tax=Tetrabaena socialis TaxID=47790 RepID=A0A2J8A1N6_9CHLO|nr:Organic cation/carnitine transporter 4 [Tetrabaena socialis]|eukprot:PNH06441.1 Organic cation/carnitine transporter 4 [Tetrabaena socialis]